MIKAFTIKEELEVKRILTLILVLSTLTLAVSCTDRVHMNDIKDEYTRNIHTMDPSQPLIGGAVIAAEGVSYSEMLDLVEEYIVVDFYPGFFYPREGKFETEDGEKFIAKVGVCRVFYSTPAVCRIVFRLRIFDVWGYLIVEDDIESHAWLEEKDFDSVKWTGVSPEIMKYWKAVATQTL